MESSEYDNDFVLPIVRPIATEFALQAHTIDQAQSKENGNKMKKWATKANNTDPRFTSTNQECAKMYIMTLRSLKSTKQMHFI